MNGVPQSIQSVLWSTDVNHLNVVSDKAYIIHQIFAHGTLDQFRWLFTVYDKASIAEIFTTFPCKDYRRSRFYFVAHHLLHLSSLPDERRYVHNTHRIIRQ